MNTRYAIVKIADIRGFIRRNPQACEGYAAGPFGWCVREDWWTKKNKPIFRKALKDSILKDGIRNPLLGWSFKEGLFIGFGTGRLKAARELGMEEVPMIVNDFVGKYSDAPKVTKENFADFFTDVPMTYSFTKFGFDYHYNLTKSTRKFHDPGGVEWYEGEVSDFYGEFPYIRPMVDDS